MQIYVYRNNNQSGPHDEDVIKSQLGSGGLSPNDLGCRVGDTQWIPLGDMYPDAVVQQPASAAPVAAVADTTAAPTAKKGGCLRPALLSLGILGLVLGVIIAVGGQFIPSVSCRLYDEDTHQIDKLRSDLEKAKGDGDFDKVNSITFQLNIELGGAEASYKNCQEDKFRNNAVTGAGALMAIVGLLMTVIGMFVGRKK